MIENPDYVLQLRYFRRQKKTPPCDLQISRVHLNCNFLFHLKVCCDYTIYICLAFYQSYLNLPSSLLAQK